MFRHQPRHTTIGALCAAARSAAEGGSALDVLLAAAELECASSDAGAPGAAMAGDFGVQAARFYLGTGPRPALPCDDFPADVGVTLSAWEGVRYYALWPQGYADAARAWRASRGLDPGAIWVLGLRSAGSLLAPLVIAALAPAPGDPLPCCTTVRPNGHPFDRSLEFDQATVHAIRRWPGEFLIVDEGPGLSGSSFGGAVRALAACGVAEQRITLMPAWAPNTSASARLCNDFAAARWQHWQVVPARPLPPPLDAERDLSGGQWRGVLHPDTHAPVWAAHERLKYLCDRGQVVAKFAGWGAYGRATLERARRLAHAGWGPPLAGDGWDEPWIRYRRLDFLPWRTATSEWCEFAGRYLAWTAAEFPLDGEPGLTQLDARMLPWEWGFTRRGWVKFDGTDHGDDPFFPGPADIAWDLAAIAVEFGSSAGAAVATEFRAASGQLDSDLDARIADHRGRYRAFRLAFCTMAASAEAARYRCCEGAEPSGPR